MTSYIDKRLFVSAIGHIYRGRNGPHAKISVDTRIQLDLVGVGLLRKIRRVYSESCYFAERTTIDLKLTLKAIKSMVTKDMVDDLLAFITETLNNYNTYIREHHDEEDAPRESTRISLRTATRLHISPSACKRIIKQNDSEVMYVSVESYIALAAFIEHVIHLFVYAVETSGSVLQTANLIEAISNDGILRDFVVKNGIYFCGAGVPTLSSHGVILSNNCKSLISYTKMREILYALLQQKKGSAVAYKLAESAVRDLFSFIEANVVNVLHDVVETVWRLAHTKRVTPKHVRDIAEIRGLPIHEPNSPLRLHTAERFLRAAGCEEIVKKKDGETVEAIISSLLEYECARILDTVIALMDYTNRAILKPKFIREAGLQQGKIICSYVRPQEKKKHA